MDINIDALRPAHRKNACYRRPFPQGPHSLVLDCRRCGPAGQALLVGLCIWRLAGAKKSQTVFFGNSDLKPLGIDRAAKSRALRALEGAGLIKIARQHGRLPKIVLLCARGTMAVSNV